MLYKRDGEIKSFARVGIPFNTTSMVEIIANTHVVNSNSINDVIDVVTIRLQSPTVRRRVKILQNPFW